MAGQGRQGRPGKARHGVNNQPTEEGKVGKYAKVNEAVSRTKTSNLIIEQPSTMRVGLEICGTAALLQHNFGQKAIEEMLRKHMGLSVQREKKSPAQCIENATILNVEGKVCIPPTALKKAMLTAASLIKGLKKTQLRIQLYVVGGSIPISYSRMVPQMDMCRTSGMGRTPDVRFRPRFEDWSARVIIEFADQLPVQTVVDLMQRAGKVGVGEWRPERDGDFGTFEVKRNILDPKELEEVAKACRPSLRRLEIPSWAMDVELTPDILRKIAGGGDDDEEEEEEVKAGGAEGEGVAK
jgi:hypothetical protein